MSEDTAYKNLAHAIVVRAIDDWHELCSARACSAAFAELRNFFRSEWCADLCDPVDSLLILEKLEKEREQSLEI